MFAFSPVRDLSRSRRFARASMLCFHGQCCASSAQQNCNKSCMLSPLDSSLSLSCPCQSSPDERLCANPFLINTAVDMYRWSDLEWDEAKLEKIVRPGPMWPQDQEQVLFWL